MPINLSEAGLDKFINDPDPADFLQWATDLFTLATGISSLPADVIEARIVSNAIYQMAWYLMEDHNNREAYMSQFSSERLGGYSYSKMNKTVESGDLTQVPAFDLAIEYFAGKDRKARPMVESEHVFEQGYKAEPSTTTRLTPVLPPYSAEEVEEGIWVVPSTGFYQVAPGVWSI